MDSSYASTEAHQDDTDRAAHALYEAEVHLHAAHQSKVDEWIRAAAARLHDAIACYEAALAASAPTTASLAA